MLNICIVFAQLERETIQKRVSDAYYSRSQKGFRRGGKPPYGYRLEENHATPEQMEKVASNISLWGEIDFEEKRFTVDKMIRSLKVFPGSVQIQWKF